MASGELLDEYRWSSSVKPLRSLLCDCLSWRQDLQVLWSFWTMKVIFVRTRKEAKFYLCVCVRVHVHFCMYVYILADQSIAPEMQL